MSSPPPPPGRKRRFSYRELAEITGRMARGKFTIRQLVRTLGISKTSAHNWTHALHDAGLIHIAEYTRSLKGNKVSAAVYQWGSGDDAPYPERLSAAEVSRRYRARKHRLDGWVGVRPYTDP